MGYCWLESSSIIKCGNISGFKCCSFNNCKRKASVPDRPNSELLLAQNCDLKWEICPLFTLYVVRVGAVISGVHFEFLYGVI